LMGSVSMMGLMSSVISISRNDKVLSRSLNRQYCRRDQEYHSPVLGQ
jgi:hypothetical protein